MKTEYKGFDLAAVNAEVAGFVADGLQMKIQRCDEHNDTTYTIHITDERMANCQFPDNAIHGDDWLAMVDGYSVEETFLTQDGRGYWDLDPEGMAMQFLRLAWLAAQHEQAARQVPFNGDNRTYLDKLKDSPGGLYGDNTE